MTEELGLSLFNNIAVWIYLIAAVGYLVGLQ